MLVVACLDRTASRVSLQVQPLQVAIADSQPLCKSYNPRSTLRNIHHTPESLSLSKASKFVLQLDCIAHFDRKEEIQVGISVGIGKKERGLIIKR